MRFIVFCFTLLAWATSAPLRWEETLEKEEWTTNLEDWLADLDLPVLVLVLVLAVLAVVGFVLLVLARLHNAVRADIRPGVEERASLINWMEDVESSRGLHHDWSDRDRLSQASSVPVLDLTLLEVELTDSCPGDSAGSESPPSVELAGPTLQWVAPEHWHYASAPESPPFARSGCLTARRKTSEPTDVVISIVSAPELTDSGPGDSAGSEFLLSVELACLSAPQWVAPEY